MPPEAPEIEVLYTVGEVANALRRSEKYVRGEIHADRLVGYRVGDQLRIRERDFLSWLEEQRSTGPAAHKNRYAEGRTVK